MPPKVIAVVGPTAAGKSGAAVDVARALGGEVVNADSMQLYRGMDIGTAKLPMSERRGVAHHLLDIWDVREEASVAGYQQLAREVIEDLLAAGRTPVVVGGSGLYVRAAVDDLEFPGTDAALRGTLEAELAAVGAPALHAQLHARDPAAAAAIQPGNGRRIVRALEVIALTGRPFSARPGMTSYSSPYDIVIAGLSPAREDLDERIAVRVEAMWAAGFVDEVRGLEWAGLREGRTASRALGYQQVLAQLAGECSESEARVATASATRRFARRQLSWFRRDPRIGWHPDAASLVGDLTAAGRN